MTRKPATGKIDGLIAPVFDPHIGTGRIATADKHFARSRAKQCIIAVEVVGVVRTRIVAVRNGGQATGARITPRLARHGNQWLVRSGHWRRWDLPGWQTGLVIRLTIELAIRLKDLVHARVARQIGPAGLDLSFAAETSWRGQQWLAGVAAGAFD